MYHKSIGKDLDQKTEISSMEEASIKQMGAIIGKMKAKFGNSADGAVLAKIVKEELV